MSKTLIIILPADADAPQHWLLCDDGTVAARGLGDAYGEEATRLVAFVPASDVATDWLDLPDLPAAQRDAVAKQHLADQVLGPLDEVHVVTAGPIAAWVAHDTMAAWMGRLARRPDCLIPAALAVPASSDGLVSAVIGDELVLRGPQMAALADPALVQALGQPITALPTAQTEAALIAAAEFPPLDLLAGRYIARQSWFDAKTVRQLALLAVAALALMLATQVVQIWKTNHAATALEGEARAQAAGLFPQAIDPLAELTRQVAAKRGGGAGFLPTMAAVTNALISHPLAELTSANFDRSGVLSVGVRAPTPGDIAAIRQRIMAAGFAVDQGAAVSEQGRVVVQLKVSGT